MVGNWRYRLGSVTLDARRDTVTGPSGEVRLQPRVTDFFVCLAQRPGEVVDRQRLIAEVWDNYPGADQSLSNAASKLRGALEAAGGDRASLETVPRRGYRLRSEDLEEIPASQPTVPRIAVLPFRTLGLDPEDEYLGEAIAEDLHYALGEAQGISITARTSSFALAQRGEPLSEFASQLGATIAIEGTVRRTAGTLLLRIALSATEAGVQHWSADFEVPEVRIGSLSTKIFEALCEELRITQSINLQRRAYQRSPDVSAAAYKAFLKGRYFWYRENSNPGRAMELYRQAIELAPEFAAPYAGLVDCFCSYGAWQMMPQKQARKMALSSAEQAYSIAPESTSAQFSHGYAQFYARWRWDGAEKMFRRVLRRQPDHILANSFLGMLLTALRRDDEAIQVGNRLVELDPASSWCWWIRGLWAFYRRDFECMAECGVEALEVSPDDPLVLWIASAGLAHCGDISRARTLVAELESRAGRLDIFLGIAATVRIFCGERRKAESLCAELENRSRERSVSPLVMSFVYGSLGRSEAALDALEAAYEERNMVLWFASRELTLDCLRDQPRFDALLSKMRLPRCDPASRD